VILAGRFLLRPFFRYIAATHLREMFTVTALLLVVGIALLMERVGLSPALGAFLAGVVLAESEYRQQLETDIEPFKGLLLGLFFISVGAGINFALIAGSPGIVASLVVAILVVKFLVLLAVSRYSRLGADAALSLRLRSGAGRRIRVRALFLCDAKRRPYLRHGESARRDRRADDGRRAVLMTINERLVQPRFASVLPEREPDEIDERDNPVVVAGVGRFGHIVARLLRLNGYGTTVLDHDAEQVETLGRFGIKSYYGDATRLDLLQTAGAERAQLFVIAIDQEEQALKIVDLIREHFPQLRILARATSRQHAYELLRRGVQHIYRETFGSAVDLSVDALVALGLPKHRAQRAAQLFREHEDASVREMAQLDTEDMKGYVSMARLHIANLENALASDKDVFQPSANAVRDGGADASAS
jgi:Kef-type K+ transport systems, membrane components